MKIKKIIIIAILAITITSCNKKQKDIASNSTEAVGKPEFFKYEWVDIDLSKTKVKYPIIVKGRKGCKVDDSSEYSIRLDNEDWKMNYEITNYPNGIDQEMKNNAKKLIKESDAYKFEKFIIDTPDSYIIKTSAGYMVGRFVKAGEITYECSMIPLYGLKDEADAQELYKMMGMLRVK
jgi:hypothetical protein